jgi:glycosyltransferase involved in cell wall biosynthesis
MTRKIIYLANLRLPTEKAYGIQIAKMCEALADSGMEVELLAPTRDNGDVNKIFEYYGIKHNFKATVIQSPDFYWSGMFDKISFSIKQWISSTRLVRAVMLRTADIIYSRDELPIFLASFYARHPKLVFEAHKFSRNRQAYYRRFMKVNVKIITISNGVRDEFIKFGYEPGEIMVAHDGVDINVFNTEKTKSECRTILGLSQDKIIVLYAGHLYKWKGAQILARAAKNLDEQYLVVFVGGTSYHVEELKKEIEPMGLNNILILGHKPHTQIPIYLKAADILVLPNSGKEDISRLYTSPLKMFEYMTSGKPIIASDLPSTREVLTEDTAFFSQPDDPVNLSQVIKEVADHPAESEKKAQNAAQVIKKYSWVERSQKIIQFVNQNE